MGNCIETKNYKGRKVIFTEKQRQRKSLKHPELRRPEFIKRVKRALEQPTFVYNDLDKKGRQVYYLEEFKLNSRTRYTKIIVALGDPNFVISAYRPDYVKERDKAKLIYGHDNED